MQIDIISIGNSKGIRIPKAILDQCDITDSVTLEVNKGDIVLRPIVNNPREGWEAAAEQCAQHQSDYEEFPQTSFDKEEWEW